MATNFVGLSSLVSMIVVVLREREGDISPRLSTQSYILFAVMSFLTHSLRAFDLPDLGLVCLGLELSLASRFKLRPDVVGEFST